MFASRCRSFEVSKMKDYGDLDRHQGFETYHVAGLQGLRQSVYCQRCLLQSRKNRVVVVLVSVKLGL